jgi:hypothetical protein
MKKPKGSPNTTDKKVKKPSASKKRAVSKNSPVVVELPVDHIAMVEYLEKNREFINENLVNSFNYAVRKNMGGIEVFSFKGSNYVILVNKADFKDNLKNIFDYSIEAEMFETCAKVKRVLDLIDKFSFSMKATKPQPKQN